MNNEINKLLVDRAALMTGHFVLTSGLHSNKYIEKFRVLEDPNSLEIICKEMAKIYKDKDVNVIVGAAIGGILISSGVAKELNAKGIFTERVNGEMTLKRGFTIPSGSNVVIVEDIVTTGSSIKEIIQLIEKLDINIIGISSLTHRGEIQDFGYKYNPLMMMSIETWEENEIPEWLGKIPISKPGSTGK